MKKLAVLIFLFCIPSFAQEIAGRDNYDEKGNLIGSERQRQADAENGILSRGGYNPAIAEEYKQSQRKAINAPKLSNKNVKNQKKTAGATSNIYRCYSGGKPVFVDEAKKNKFGNCTLIKGQAPQDLPVEVLKDDTPNASDIFGEDDSSFVEIPDNTEGAVLPALVADNPNAAVPVLRREARPQPDSQLRENKEEVKPEEPKSALGKAMQNLAAISAMAPKKEEEEKIPCSGAILYKGSTYIFSDNEPCPIPDLIFRTRRPIEAEPSYYTN